MPDIAATLPAPHRAAALLFSRLPTGAKLFLILSVALLPLALFAVIASLGTTRTADDIVTAQLRVAIAESGRKLANELIGDMTALRATLAALEADPADAPSCARAQGVFAQQSATGTRFEVLDPQGQLLCGTKLPGDLAAAPPLPDRSITARIIPGQGITLSIAGMRSGSVAAAFFPQAFLVSTARPASLAMPHGAELLRGDEQLMLVQPPVAEGLLGRATQRIALGIDRLELQMSVRHATITSATLVAMLMPVLMWIAAAVIGWLVVDLLLIRHLQRLRSSVSAYQPGETFDTATMRSSPAYEIRDLSEAFRTLSGTVAAHEAGLAEGLVRQTRLTREVHHRVKNNLQVISSLINLHARAARTADVTDAYASIQRRVDALAVVHRHHFAELEEHRGLNLRSVIGELVSNIRATAPAGAKGLSVAIDIEPFLATQDVTIAIAFLITEMVELAMVLAPATQVRISIKPDGDATHATLRVSSPALIESEEMRVALAERYGRVIEGLSRQLRSRLFYDPLVGAYEITLAVTGRD